MTFLVRTASVTNSNSWIPIPYSILRSCARKGVWQQHQSICINMKFKLTSSAYTKFNLVQDDVLRENVLREIKF